MRRLRREDGQAMVLTAMCMPVLLGFIGLTVDVGVMSMEKRKLQAAADAAAIAGATELGFGDYTTAAQTVASLNGFTNGSNGATVQVNPSGTTTPSPLYGSYAGQTGYLEVIVTQSTPTYFMKLFNVATLPVAARAVAAPGHPLNCIYLLSSTGTAFSVIGGTKLSAPSCGLVDDSASATAASITTSATVTTASTEVVGGAAKDNSGASYTPTPITGIVPVPDPLAYLSPPTYNSSQCSADPLTLQTGGGVSYSVGPGSGYGTVQNGNLVCYNNLSMGGNGNTVTIQPGYYVVTGLLTFGNGTIKGGSGVMFYLPKGATLTFNNGSTFNLSAMTSGTYSGILFYQDRTNATAVSVLGGSTSTMSGILYFPDAQIQMSNAGTMNFSTPIIAQSLAMSGGAVFNDSDYTSTNTSSVLNSARLVE